MLDDDPVEETESDRAWSTFNTAMKRAVHADPPATTEQWDDVEAKLALFGEHSPMMAAALAPVVDLFRGRPVLMCSCSSTWPCQRHQPGVEHRLVGVRQGIEDW